MKTCSPIIIITCKQYHSSSRLPRGWRHWTILQHEFAIVDLLLIQKMGDYLIQLSTSPWLETFFSTPTGFTKVDLWSGKMSISATIITTAIDSTSEFQILNNKHIPSR